MIYRGSDVLNADLIMWRSDESLREFLHPASGVVMVRSGLLIRGLKPPPIVMHPSGEGFRR